MFCANGQYLGRIEPRCVGRSKILGHKDRRLIESGGGGFDVDQVAQHPLADVYHIGRPRLHVLVGKAPITGCQILDLCLPGSCSIDIVSEDV